MTTVYSFCIPSMYLSLLLLLELIYFCRKSTNNNQVWLFIYIYHMLLHTFKYSVECLWTTASWVDYLTWICTVHYENTPIQIDCKFFHQKMKFFRQKKNPMFFHISAQNIDYGYLLEPPRQCGSSEYPQPMFLSRNKKNNVHPCKPQFYYIKVGFKGVNII